MVMPSRRAQEQFEIAKRREVVSKLYLQGKSQLAISEIVGVVPKTVFNDLKALREQWRQNAAANFSELQSRELAKIDLIEQECWDQWDRSKKDREIHSAEKEDGLNGQKTKSGLKREGQTADTSYIDKIQWCINKRCQILGLDAPSKVAMTDPTGTKEYGGVGSVGPVGSLVNELQRAIDRFGAAPAGEDEGGTTGQPTLVDAADGPSDSGVSEPSG
jgi:transposase